MAEAALMGWDADAQVWRKLVCNAAGKLIIDPSEILEDSPTNNEVGKAPTSNWAFDHNANASAHHTRYTDAESRAAIGNLLDSTGKVLKTINFNYQELIYARNTKYQSASVSTRIVVLQPVTNQTVLQIYAYQPGGSTYAAYVDVHNGSVYERLATEVIVDSKILTHKNISDAHHARYTDAEAVAAVGYNGTKYWSCRGINFHAEYPASSVIQLTANGNLIVGADGVQLFAHVALPHGATITNVIVTGNAAASAESWYLERCLLSGVSPGLMATAAINTADSTITSPVVDNSTYAYYLVTDTMDTSDEIYGAIIEYTL